MAEDDPGTGADARRDATAAKTIADTDETKTPRDGEPDPEDAGTIPLDPHAGDGIVPDGPGDIEAPHPEGSPLVAGHEAAQRAAGDAPDEGAESP